MKPAPAPDVPGHTDSERFENAVQMILSVPKDAVLKEEKKVKAERSKKRTKKPS